MGTKVAKFGGTSLADAAQFRKVQAIVRADPERRYVVPSAPGKRHPADHKITDLLYLCHAHVQSAVPFDEVFALIERRYLEIVADLGLALDLRPHLTEVKARIAAETSAHYAASRGEYLNGLILARYLGYDFVDPADLVLFDDAGAMDLERARRSIAARLANHERAVIPGFYGALPDGQVRTFSRGGSDISGALVALGVEADLYENWTDVPGFLMADPRIVENPRPIEVVTYGELRELAYMGATVLHEEAVFPVRRAGIPIRVKHTDDPDAPGTLIVADAEPTAADGRITGIAGRKDFTVIGLEKALMNSEIGYGRRLLSVLEANDISFEHMPTGIDTICLVIADSYLEHKLPKVLDEIRRDCQPDALEVYPNMALIATVGRGMAYTPGISARLFGALGQARVNVRMIDQGSSEINIIVGVDSADFERGVRAIYHAFVE